MSITHPRQTIFFLVVLLCCFLVIQPILVPFAVGVTFAYVCEGPLAWLQRRTGRHSTAFRWFFAICIVVLLLTVFLVPLGVFAHAVLAQMVDLVNAQKNPVSVP